MRTLALTLVSCCLVLPSAASAATVGLSEDGSRIEFRSGPEDSDMIIAWTRETGFQVPYIGGDLVPGPGCVPGPPVTCDVLASWDVTLGPGDDRSKGWGTFILDEAVDAGPGDDEVYANGQRNAVTTGPGDDVGIINSNARSTLDGNSGDDRLAGSDQGGSIVDGGPGDDIVAGQNIDSNDLTGGPGADTIVSRVRAGKRFGGGSADGGTGQDVISVAGDGGLDTYRWTLTGGTGADTIIGSPGIGSDRGVSSLWTRGPRLKIPIVRAYSHALRGFLPAIAEPEGRSGAAPPAIAEPEGRSGGGPLLRRRVLRRLTCRIAGGWASQDAQYDPCDRGAARQAPGRRDREGWSRQIDGRDRTRAG